MACYYDVAREARFFVRKTKALILIIAIMILAVTACGTRGDKQISVSPVDRAGTVLSCGTEYDAEDLFEAEGAGQNANFRLYAKWIAVPDYEMYEGIVISGDGRHITVEEDHGILWVRLCVWNEGEAGYGGISTFTADVE